MNVLLDAVNEILGTKYNSMLVNRYRSRDVCLGVHKDDEECLVKEASISTLSFGCIRRMKIAPDGDKYKPVCELVLKPGSLLTMMPGFQEKYWHSIPEGRKSTQKERGLRYSVTFRQLSPQTASTLPVAESLPPVVQPTVQGNVLGNAHPDTFVFGSSLVKGLDEQMLSKYAKNFKVLCNRGATIGKIYENVERIRDSGAYDTSQVSTVFLMCGGNDVENLKAKKRNDVKFVLEDYEDLVDLVKEVFPGAKINILSLIPRRNRYGFHIDNMHKVNRWLESFCKKKSIRFVDIFSFYLVKLPNIWKLNKKLFNRDNLHFSPIGDSVLAKVLLGVANSPRVLNQYF
jgi:lysophospholipase L1-like esterase